MKKQENLNLERLSNFNVDILNEKYGDLLYKRSQRGDNE